MRASRSTPAGTGPVGHRWVGQGTPSGWAGNATSVAASVGSVTVGHLMAPGVGRSHAREEGHGKRPGIRGGTDR